MKPHSSSKRGSHIPEGAVLVDPQGTDAAIYTYELNNCLCAIAFYGRKQNPVWHYDFQFSEFCVNINAILPH